MSDPIKPRPKFQDAPIKRPIFNNAPVGTQGTDVLQSDYDKYVTPSNIQGLAYGRARNQPWYDQFANNAVKLVPAIGLGIIENAGYIGELFSPDQDYSNALTEFATKNRQALDESLPAYRQNPNAVFDLTDSGWWAQHGLGLVESIGEFLVTGAGVGAGTGNIAKLLANTIKAGKYMSAGLQGAAQLTTASTLAYTEGAMSGAQIYKEVINSGGTVEEASRAAAEVVKLNTILNTGLNITSVSPLFKTFDNLQSLNKLGLGRKAGEKLGDWSKRLTELESAGVPQASMRNALLLEAGQEALEEDVNLFAESEGRITGKLKKASSSDPIQRFLDSTFTEEGALNAILGAVGGVGQSLGIHYIPYRVGEDGKLTTNRALENIETNEAAKSYITDLREDIKYITTKQKELNKAVEENNKELINKTREDLFNVGTLRAIRNGTSEEFANEIRNIALIDNIQIGEDGKTEAVRQGFADSKEDNDYKEKAIKKANDIKQLSEEYEQLNRNFNNKFITDQVFRERLNIYSAQENIEELQVADHKLNTELSKLITDPLVSPIISESADLSATNQLINTLGNPTQPLTKQQETILGNLRSNKTILEKVIGDQLQIDPSLKAKLNENKGVVEMLVHSRSPLIFFNEELKQLKREYSNLLDNKKQTISKFEKLKEQVVEELKKKATDKKINEDKIKEKEDLKQAKQEKVANKEKYREVVGDYVITSNKEGGFDVVDEEAGEVISNHSTVEEAKAVAQSENKKSVEGTRKSIEITPTIITPKINIPDETIQPKTKETKEKEEQLISEAIKSNSTNDNVVSRANKIAYRVRETDDSPINDQYKILHSKSFNVNTKVTLKIASETSFYKEGMPTAKVPIGVYFNDKLVGFVHITSEDKPDPNIMEIREFIVKNKQVETTITDKDLGTLNIGDKKHTVSEVMPDTITFAVAKDDGKIYTKVGQSYSSDKLINKSFVSGITYAIVNTPNGKEIALPLDTKKVSKEVSNSIITAFRIFLNPQNLLPNDAALLDEIFDKYDIDIRTPKGFEKYFKLFLFNYQLTDEVDIEEKNLGKDDKRWVNFSGNGIRFLRAGGAINIDGRLQAKEVGKNTPYESQDGLIEELQSHIEKMYYNIDLELLQDNAPVSVPIFSFDKDENLIYTEYSKKTYQDHIASTTETNVIQFQVGENEYSSFVSPKIYFNTAFLGNTQEESYGKPLKKSEEKTNLPNQKPITKKKSLTKRLPSNQISSDDVTKDIIEERKKFCS